MRRMKRKLEKQSYKSRGGQEKEKNELKIEFGRPDKYGKINRNRGHLERQFILQILS